MKAQTKKAYQVCKDNQFYPFLHFQKVADDLWSVRITANPKAL